MTPLGSGGQGTVFRCHRLKTKDRKVADDEVALKLYSKKAEVERIEREVQALGRIRHPNLAGLIEYGTVTMGGQVVRYVAYQFIDGVALDRRILASPIAPATVSAVGRDVAAAIGDIWKERIVHRDVSPKNVMLRTGERDAVLIDLGIAKHLSQAPLTSKGTVWGTPGYMSPEQVAGTLKLSCASDIYSLGVVMLEGLAGKHPTDGDQDDLINTRVVAADVVPSAPAGLVQLIQRMLSPRMTFRPLPSAVAERCAILAKTL